MKMVSPPSLAEVKRLVRYDAETGIFTHHPLREGRGKLVPGGVAGCCDKDGYWRIALRRRGFRAARLAWFYVTGEWPPEEVDHINGNKNDNRFANLRLCSRRDNAYNRGLFKSSTTGFKGVYFEKDRGLYRACIKVGGKSKKLGRFKTAEEAHAAYIKAAKEAAGGFANNG